MSIAAGVAALTSAFPQWHVNRVELALGFVLILMLGNLRGIRESGRIFAVPTYFFVVTTLTLIAVGAWHALTGSVHPVTTDAPMQVATQPLTLFLLLTAFSNGCTAMTGVEAVSNGVPAFKPPESKNAAATMLMMAVLSITMFLGITLLAQSYHVLPSDQETVVSQLARGVFGYRGVAYYAVQAATMLILVLAANTAYADFPRLASILARDRLPAAPVHEPGRPPGLLERHRRPERVRGDPARRLRRRHARVDSALHDRRLRLVHAVAGRHGGAVAAAASGPGWRSSAIDQRRSARWSPASS